MRRPPRRADLLLGVYVALCALALVWPGFAWVPAVQPRILGLPFALVWIVGWSLATFAALVVYHGWRGSR